MIGNNDLVFNQATMIEIVQYYIDHVLLRENHGAKVFHIAHEKHGLADTYRVLVAKEQSK